MRGDSLTYLFIQLARHARHMPMPFLCDGGLQVYIYLGARSRQDAEYFSQKRVRSYTALHPLALLDALYYFFFGGLRFIFACNETRSALPCLTDTPGSSNWWCPMRLTTEKCHFSDDYVVVFANNQKKNETALKKIHLCLSDIPWSNQIPTKVETCVYGWAPPQPDRTS